MKHLKFVSVLLGILFALTITMTNARASNELSRHIHPLLGIAPNNTFVVTKTNDTGDNTHPGDGTLRWALVQANGTPGFDLIIFDIPGSGVQTINVKYGLPDLSDDSGVWIDGTQSDDRIEIDGTQTSNHHGIPVISDNNVIQGLVINHIPDYAAAIGLYDSASYNVIIGNYLGTNPAGTTSNSASAGIYIAYGSHDNVVGGTNGVTPGGACTGDCNLMSGNRGSGLVIDHANNNRVIGNFIGLNASGKAALPNGDDGVLLGNAWDNVIGGTTPEERNVISGNHRVNVEMGEPQAKRNLIQGNYIGTNSAGDVSLGGVAEGVLADHNAADNKVDSNVISGNGGAGILIFLGATRNKVTNNLIGYAANGTSPLPNRGIGILVQSNNNQITGNKIGNHPTDGIRIKSGTGNAIRMNTTWNNNKLGINLGKDAVTFNDTSDNDGGANLQQNYPVISKAGTANSTLTIQGTLNSRPNGRFALDLFASPSCDNTYDRNVGEGKTYLGSVDVTTNSSGNGSFTATFSNAPTSGIVIGTATDANNNTSEYSTCRVIEVVTPSPAPPELLTPSNGGTPPSNPPNLDWNASANTTYYVVTVKQDSRKGTTVHVNKNVLQDQYTLPTQLAAGHTYFWQIKACNSANVCAKSTWFTFTIQ